MITYVKGVMNANEITEYKETSRSMFNEVCDPISLVSINIDNLTLKEIVSRFLGCKASKTDFSILICALEFWDKETSIIYIDSYSLFRSITKTSLANANLSRALKSLEGYGFIRKVGDHNRLEYLFDIPFSILQLESGQYTISALSNKTT
jgi:hypothetical protein